MTTKSVKKSSTKKRSSSPTGYEKVPIAECIPNPWNPNVLDQDSRVKLLAGMKRLLNETGRIPPIVVRPHPNQKQAKYQIIDGEHRWRVLTDDGFTEIDVFILDVNDGTAMILTDTLNYLRGEPDADKYGDYLTSLVQAEQLTVPEIASYLPQTEDEITDLLEQYSIDITHIEIESETNPDDAANQADKFVEVKFFISTSQAEIVEAELARVGSFMKGKNLRGRALEFMAVNSSLTPIDNLTGEEPEEPEEKPKRKRSTKSKLKEKAA